MLRRGVLDGNFSDTTGATTVPVTAGSTHTGVDVSLAAAGAVSGTVTDTAAHPLVGVEVEVFNAGLTQIGTAYTAANGTYTVGGLAAGTYDVCFDGTTATGGSSTTGYLDQCYNDVAWDGSYCTPAGPRRWR